MSAHQAPSDAAALAAIITAAAAQGRRVELRGGGSKADIGMPDRGCSIIDMTAFTGIVDYDPPELVLTVGASTPLAEIEALVAAEGQMLAFEPFDHGPVFGRPAGSATIGGVVAAGVSGSRRLSAGAVRDHLLGFKGVSGRGEIFVGGAKVVKNVTGYDLPKLMAGSWGRLAALTELTFKLLPAPRASATLVLAGLSDRTAAAAMAQAMRSQAEVAAAGHLPAQAAGGQALTLLRLEGFGPSVAARAELLHRLLGGEIVGGSDAQALWRTVKTLAPLATGALLWRINVAPSAGWRVVEMLRSDAECWLYDWAGGLVWLTTSRADAPVRMAAEQAGGHAMLVRADHATRGSIPALHPEPAGVAALARRVKHAFDPAGVLDPDRFGSRPDAG